MAWIMGSQPEIDESLRNVAKRYEEERKRKEEEEKKKKEEGK